VLIPTRPYWSIRRRSTPAVAMANWLDVGPKAPALPVPLDVVKEYAGASAVPSILVLTFDGVALIAVPVPVPVLVPAITEVPSVY